MARKNTTARAVKSRSNTMWGGRYKLGPAEIMERINASIGFDRRLYAQDIAGSLAHCRHAGGPGHPDGQGRPRHPARAAAGARAEIESGRFKFSTKLEDIHFNVEARLTELIGAGRRPAAHRALAQRPGGARRPAVGARHHRPAGADAGRPAGGPDRPRRGICRHHHAGLHASADGAADHLRPSSAGLCRDVRPRPQPVRRLPRAPERIAAGRRGACRLAASHRSAARRPRRWASTGRWPTRSMPCPTATMSSSSSPRPRSRPCTCRGCPRRS